ncbi:MAG TPA: hypothetical protein VFQ59_03565 [Candidatus Paceibacterota bacterium]|nr:hypothetical protein [Candidatus Paceibacterota bacterium]
MNKLEWVALEYEEKDRSPDWFWALGVIVVAGAIASIIFKNYFFAIFLLVSGGLMILFALKKPDLVTYELNRKGLKIRNRLYPFENIRSFWVQRNPTAEERDLHGNLPEEELEPTLFIRTDRAFIPIISVPIQESHADSIRNVMKNHEIKEELMKDHPADKIMDFIGF